MTQTATRPLAVVTGGSAGLGREFAAQLADRGYDLLLVARDGARLRTLADELTARHGVAAEPWAADLATEAGVTPLVERLADEPRTALLVNNAGFGTKGRLVTRPEAEQRAMLEPHVMAPMRLARAVLPGMVTRKRGMIINVASVASFTASPGNVNYCATKAYERVMCEALAMELVGTGVTVQALCPGFTHTEFHGRANIDKTGGIPAWALMDADREDRESLAAAHAGGPVVVVPGKRYQAIVLALRYMPQWVRRTLQQRYGKART
ncbi:MAG: SDR family NAD(P)-dependent oxidoreductase [Gemmatimonadota bacterium]